MITTQTITFQVGKCYGNPGHRFFICGRNGDVLTIHYNRGARSVGTCEVIARHRDADGNTIDAERFTPMTTGINAPVYVTAKQTVDELALLK